MTPRPRKMATNGYSKSPVEFIQSDWFCPACGQRGMWQEVDSGGDYYHDCEVRCFSCDHRMCCVGHVEDTPAVKAPWWDEVSAKKVGCVSVPVSEASAGIPSEAQKTHSKLAQKGEP